MSGVVVDAEERQREKDRALLAQRERLEGAMRWCVARFPEWVDDGVPHPGVVAAACVLNGLASPRLEEAVRRRFSRQLEPGGFWHGTLPEDFEESAS